jgi:hypothetical protein
MRPSAGGAGRGGAGAAHLVWTQRLPLSSRPARGAAASGSLGSTRPGCAPPPRAPGSSARRPSARLRDDEGQCMTPCLSTGRREAAWIGPRKLRPLPVPKSCCRLLPEALPPRAGPQVARLTPPKPCIVIRWAGRGRRLLRVPPTRHCDSWAEGRGRASAKPRPSQVSCSGAGRGVCLVSWFAKLVLWEVAQRLPGVPKARTGE